MFKMVKQHEEKNYYRCSATNKGYLIDNINVNIRIVINILQFCLVMKFNVSEEPCWTLMFTIHIFHMLWIIRTNMSHFGMCEIYVRPILRF